jgi:hypothetical protein
VTRRKRLVQHRSAAWWPRTWCATCAVDVAPARRTSISGSRLEPVSGGLKATTVPPVR